MRKKFEKSFKLAMDKTIKASEKAIKEALQETFIDIIDDTPVGDPKYWKQKPSTKYKPGSLRGNWNTSLNTPSTSFKESRKQTKRNGVATTEVKSTLNKYTIDDSVFMANNAPYAQRVNGGYIVNPNFTPLFVDVNVEKWKMNLKAAVQRNKL